MSSKRMPVIFIGHGSPMNAIEDNEFSQTWQQIGKTLPKPKAILSISAHWETAQPQVTAMLQPKTIHDFYGFPRELNEMEYPASGSTELADRVLKLLENKMSTPDLRWGLDHGTWSVLARMYPKADIPVVQLSLAQTRDGQFHYDLGQQLSPLREEGILILGSGNIVHNLRMMQFDGQAYDWAEEFDKKAKECIDSGQHAPLIQFQQLGRAASLAINSAEHYLPLLYILALQSPQDDLRYYCEKLFYGSLSMRCVQFG
jgi:4,5-DOPA dioxygenase extradiol